jgi:hypothetical protein
MTAVNLLLFSEVISNLHNLKRVVWIGVHIDILEYMKMSEVRMLKESSFNYRKRSEVSLKTRRHYCFPHIIASWAA